ncbi:MAG: hypothetical protein ACREM8_05420, partial [Vulcanimicrobiaceae bacterium]
MLGDFLHCAIDAQLENRARGRRRRNRRTDEALANPDLSSSHATLLGQTVGPNPADVVEVDPVGGLHRLVYYDPATWLVARTETAVRGRTKVVTFGDYRRFDGRMVAATRTFSDGFPADDASWKLQRLSADPGLATAALAVPSNARTLDEFPAGQSEVALPAHFGNQKVIVRVTIAGRGLDFAIDSGSSNLVLDPIATGALQERLHVRG